MITLLIEVCENFCSVFLPKIFIIIMIIIIIYNCHLMLWKCVIWWDINLSVKFYNYKKFFEKIIFFICKWQKIINLFEILNYVKGRENVVCPLDEKFSPSPDNKIFKLPAGKNFPFSFSQPQLEQIFQQFSFPETKIEAKR